MLLSALKKVQIVKITPLRFPSTDKKNPLPPQQNFSSCPHPTWEGGFRPFSLMLFGKPCRLYVENNNVYLYDYANYEPTSSQ